MFKILQLFDNESHCMQLNIPDYDNRTCCHLQQWLAFKAFSLCVNFSSFFSAKFLSFGTLDIVSEKQSSH